MRIRARAEAGEFTGQLQRRTPEQAASTHSNAFSHSAGGQRSEIKVPCGPTLSRDSSRGFSLASSSG